MRTRVRCQALGDDGTQCLKKAAERLIDYHGDPEVYLYGEPWPTWVRVRLCEKHSPSSRPCP